MVVLVFQAISNGRDNFREIICNLLLFLLLVVLTCVMVNGYCMVLVQLCSFACAVDA
jgi:hypothetical protein